MLVLLSPEGRASTLLSETFDSALPGSAYNASIPGAAFVVTAGDVDIMGNIGNGASGFFTCPMR